MDSHGLAILRAQGFTQKRDFGYFGRDHLFFGGEREHSCKDASCAVPVLHRTLGLFLGCCIHPSCSYGDSLEAEAHFPTKDEVQQGSTTYSGVLEQQQER